MENNIGMMGPACVQYFTKSITLSWYKDGKHHREGGPASVTYGLEYNIIEEYWCKDNRKHRDDGPAEVVYGLKGNIISERWFNDGQKYREEGPSYGLLSNIGNIWKGIDNVWSEREIPEEVTRWVSSMKR